ncbi:hypothetical protein [Streptomyces sp. NPDC017941]|uniref:hypothetical protein n=1 Tax=Streptomyces sp. NPDC017941 TaxID=3365018 RepID=UPI0037979AE0
MVQEGPHVGVVDPARARDDPDGERAHGFEPRALARSAAIFDALRAEWTRELGPDRVRALESDLRAVVPAESFRLDAAGWLGGA